MQAEIGKKIAVDKENNTQSSLLSPQSCSFLTSHHLFADVCAGLLNVGQGVRFRANGWSMYPTICDGEIINVEPVLPSQVRHGDIILYRSQRGVIAHRVVHVQREINSVLSPQPSVKLSGHWVIRLLGHFWVSLSPNSQRRTPNFPTCPSTLDPRPSTLVFYTRGDSLTAEDFPVMADQILGKVFSVERNGRAVALYGNRAIMLQETRLFVFQLKQYVVYVVYVIRGIKAFFPKRRVSFKVNGAKTQ